MTLCITWTIEREEELKKLHIEGLSASQIAFKLGGTTRNAVIGKRARMGLAAVNKPHVHNVPRAPRKPGTPKNKGHHHAVFRIVAANGNSNAMRVVKTVGAESFKLRCVEVTPLHIGFADLEPGLCKYPFGDEPRTMTFCGLPSAKASYCPSHNALCWVAPVAPKPKAWVRAA